MKNNTFTKSKIFDSTIRIQILASLYTSELTYNQLKKVCQVADGAMTNHTNKLHMAGCIDVKKNLLIIVHKQLTVYKRGKNEFEKFVDYLNTAIKSKS